MTSGMFLLHHLSNLATHRHFTIGSKLGNTNTLKCCPCREASGIKGKWMASFHRGALFVARWFLGVGALAFTAHRVQACSTTESHFREPRDQLFWQHRLGSELLCPTCYMIQSPVCWSTNNLMKILDSGTFNILSYFCFFNINLFTYGAKKCSGVYALGPWDI